MQLEHPALGCKPDAIAAPDWAQIRTDYELGEISVREIARRHSVSDTAIHKRARAENWRGLHQPQTTGANHDAPPLQTDVQTKPDVTIMIGGKVVAELDTDIDRFKWSPDNTDVLVRGTPALAIYMNPWGQIVLRQESESGPDDDPFVRIDRRDVPALVKRLRELADG
jgi:hypothetical protein